jgi:RHS repeat-associated protein
VQSVAVLYKSVLAEPVWDEENRLRLVDTNPSTPTPEGIAVYTYDAGGERAIKKVVNSGFWSVNEPNTLQTNTRNGAFMANLYPSGLLNVTVKRYTRTIKPMNFRVITDVRYTKHYYAGSQRVMSKVGSDKNIGKFDCSWLIIPFAEGGVAAEKPEETLAKADKSEAKLLKAYNITPAPDYGQNAGYAQNCISSHGIDFAAEKAQSYWYHSDHLGSASYITGVDGKVCSNINYFPTGEVFVEQNRNSPNLPYKFNGKELDAETGYYYYGARYYNPKVSLWLNVDPLAEKTGAPYNYCYNNPVKLVDPDGMEPTQPGDGFTDYINSHGGINAFGPKLPTPTRNDWQNRLEMAVYRNNVNVWNKMSYEDKMASVRYKMGMQSLNDQIRPYAETIAKGYTMLSELGGSGMASGGRFVASNASKAMNAIEKEASSFYKSGVTALKSLFGRGASQMTGAETAITLSKKGFSNGATAQLTIDGGIFVGVSSGVKPFQLTDEMLGILMYAGRKEGGKIPSWFGGCAEVSAIQQARAAGYSWSQIRSGALEAYNIGGKAGSVKPLCTGCSNMLSVLPK